MAKSKARWLALIDDYSAQPQNHKKNCGCKTVGEQVAKLPKEFATTTTKMPLETSIDLETKTEQENADVMTKELPIYETTAAQIEYWHAYGDNVFLQKLLREYDLDCESPNVAAYNHFKIGLDEKRHVATFAVDETHYYAIKFNQWNSAPVNQVEALLVLEKISAIRFATRHFKNFCDVQIEYFD